VELKKKEIISFYIFKNENKSMRIFNKLSNYLLKNKIDDLIDELILNNFTNKTILKYIREIPREIFVKKKFVNFSYHNRPLPIDCNQTISQPLVVANMIDCLNIKKTDLVLEIGTGTGYQTALLSYLCKHVFTIEIFEKLINQAKINHAKLNLKNISYLLGDGSNGWNKPILFDSIIISAATKKISSKLLKTLKTKGKIIFPKEYFPRQQKLLLLKKLNERNYSTQELFDVSFVPLL
jgi:protein-L-isoaspartate(D-aspartate) O-methyltransferase